MAELSLYLGKGDNISWPTSTQIFLINFFDLVIVHQEDTYFPLLISQVF